MIWGTNPGRGRRFFSSIKYLDCLWVPSSLLFNKYQAAFPGVKRERHEVDHSPPPSTEVRNEWSSTSTPSI
jgi:hypothetical protein